MKEMEKILITVHDLEELANGLGLEDELYAVEVDCNKRPRAQAKCQRRGLVKEYCQQNGGMDNTILDFTEALIEIGLIKQANDLIKLGTPTPTIRMLIWAKRLATMTLVCAATMFLWKYRRKWFSWRRLFILVPVLFMVVTLQEIQLLQQQTSGRPNRLSLHVTSQSYSRTSPSSPANYSLTSTQPPTTQPSTTQSPTISSYAKKLRKEYAKIPPALPDKLDLTLGKEYVKLVLVKNEVNTEAEADKFVRLEVTGDVDQILAVKEEIEMKDIFKAGEKTRLVVVEGPPGVGKSTLALELCHQWQNETLLGQYSLVLLLRLREERVRSATDVTDFFFSLDEELRDDVVKEVKKGQGEGVLFIFDGFDELPIELRKKSLVIDMIKDPPYLSEATIMVTSRPSASADLHPLLKYTYSKRIEVVGFTKNASLQAASTAFNNSKIFSYFLRYLSANRAMEAIMHNPLSCAIVVNVYMKSFQDGRPVPHTQTQLYTELSLRLISSYQAGKGAPGATNLPSKLEDYRYANKTIYRLLKLIGELAYKGMVHKQVIFKSLPGNSSDLGLLIEHHSMFTGNETSTYGFFHLTLQEYLSAFYISQLDEEEQRVLLNVVKKSSDMSVILRFFAGYSMFTGNETSTYGFFHLTLQEYLSAFYISQLDEEEQRVLLNVVKKSSDMSVILRFFAGLTKMEKVGWDLLTTSHYSSILSAPGLEKYLYIDPVIIQCFYEANILANCKILFHETNIVLLGISLTAYDMYALGYTICLSKKIWYTYLHQLTTERGLEMFSHGLKYNNHSKGLINTLGFGHSYGLLNEGRHLLQFPQYLLQKIEILNLIYCKIDAVGFQNLAMSIPHLSSLTGLAIEGNPGGPGHLVNLMQSLATHRELEILSMHKVALGLEDISALSAMITSSHSLTYSVGGWPNSTFERDRNLMSTTFSPSSLEQIEVFFMSSSYDDLSILDSINVIRKNVKTLTICDISQSEVRRLNAEKFSRVLGKNISLKKLKLYVHIEKHDLVNLLVSLKENDSLETLELLRSMKEVMDSLHNGTLDARIEFVDDYLSTKI